MSSVRRIVGMAAAAVFFFRAAITDIRGFIQSRTMCGNIIVAQIRAGILSTGLTTAEAGVFAFRAAEIASETGAIVDTIV